MLAYDECKFGIIYYLNDSAFESIELSQCDWCINYYNDFANQRRVNLCVNYKDRVEPAVLMYLSNELPPEKLVDYFANVKAKTKRGINDLFHDSRLPRCKTSKRSVLPPLTMYTTESNNEDDDDDDEGASVKFTQFATVQCVDYPAAPHQEQRLNKVSKAILSEKNCDLLSNTDDSDAFAQSTSQSRTRKENQCSSKRTFQAIVDQPSSSFQQLCSTPKKKKHSCSTENKKKLVVGNKSIQQEEMTQSFKSFSQNSFLESHTAVDNDENTVFTAYDRRVLQRYQGRDLLRMSGLVHAYFISLS